MTLAPELQADLDSFGAESRFADAGAVRLHALDYGGDGPALFVLPGITSPAATFDFVAQRLRDRARVVVLDVRGRGLSDPAPDGDYSLETYAADAAAAIRGLGLERPIVLGHSMGARIAAALAVREPDLVGASLLVDPPLSGPGRDPYPTTREAFVTQLHEAQAGTTADEVARFWPGWPRRELELRARWLPTCDETAVVETHRGFETEDFFDWWPRVPQPVALMRGGRSLVVTDEGAQELASARPEVPIVVVEDAGHMIPWDQEDAFVSAVQAFLEERRRAAAMTSHLTDFAETASDSSTSERER